MSRVFAPCRECGRSHIPGSRNQRKCNSRRTHNSVTTADLLPTQDFENSDVLSEYPPATVMMPTYHRVWLHDGGKVVAHLSYNESSDHLMACDIEVRDGYQGQGFARKIIETVEQELGKPMFTTGSFTPKGYHALHHILPIHPAYEEEDGPSRIEYPDTSFVYDWDERIPKY